MDTLNGVADGNHKVFGEISCNDWQSGLIQAIVLRSSLSLSYLMTEIWENIILLLHSLKLWLFYLVVIYISPLKFY